MIYIGTAGWTIPRAVSAEFSGPGTHLQRYATALNAAEINTTFYRPHKPATFARWADSVPDAFRFSVKIPKTITHEHKLIDTTSLLSAFLTQLSPLGDKLGGLLTQLPPSLQYDAARAHDFFASIRAQYDGAIACEPRHASWFTPDATQLLTDNNIARVAADPALIHTAAIPAGAPNVVYMRLHGSPRVYYSPYDDVALANVSHQLLEAHNRGATAWCIFDNTASGAAAADALKLQFLCARGETGGSA